MTDAERHSSESRSRLHEPLGRGHHNVTSSSLTTDRGLDDPTSKNQASKRSRLNLLNPMSLLARRRFSQNNPRLEDVTLSIHTPSVPSIPENFDPSIRGKIVHDFSAPRPRRLNSYNEILSNESSPLSAPPRPSYERPRLSESQSAGLQLPPSQQPMIGHSPVFKEHFQDDRQTVQPERTSWLHTSTGSHGLQAPDPSHLPAFAKRLPSVVLEESAVSTESLSPPKAIADTKHVPAMPDPSTTPSPPPAPVKETLSPTFNLPPASPFPKHMKSTSSRFSFQLGGQASSAQEKLLEDKHKEHEATKRSAMTDKDDEIEEDDYADYDFDADDGLEEQIPGVNANADDESLDDDVLQSMNDIGLEDGYHNVYQPAAPFEQDGDMLPQQASHFTPQSLTFSPTSTQHASQPTPRDSSGHTPGVDDTKDGFVSEDLYAHEQGHVRPGDVAPFYHGLGISTFAPSSGLPLQRDPQQPMFDESDLYFDDGEFDEEFENGSQDAFDEDIFDDETGRIRNIPAENAKKLEAALQAAGPQGEITVMPRIAEDRAKGINFVGESVDTEEVPEMGSRREAGRASFAQGDAANLTEVNLAAYHDALAEAANQAAAEGKFGRHVSFSQVSEEETSASRSLYSQTGHISDEGVHSFGFPSSGIAEDDGFPFDDDMDDDLMIAEANAEALENDDEGFYGQEFGFYARAHGKESVEMSNGGYFAQRGSNGIKRSHSGKEQYQEPSLTPITERSEWSTRNSVASLQIPGLPGSAHSLPSPGIAQLLELEPSSYEDEMTLSALLRLRRGAFGGSSTSVNSIGGGHPSSSPLAQHSTQPWSSPDYAQSKLARSMHSMASSAGPADSEDEDETGNAPTLTQNTPRKKTVHPAPTTPLDTMPLSPSTGAGDWKRGGHSRNSSGADSVSYARETDGRWVLERRRTGDDGGLEVIGREYLAGTRI